MKQTLLSISTNESLLAFVKETNVVNIEFED